MMKYPSDRFELGRIIKRLRKERGLGIRPFAELAGLSPQGLINIEQGHRSPKFETIVAVLAALNARMCIDEQADNEDHGRTG